jgi:hypothetical protein
MVTMTASPEQHYRMLCQAIADQQARAVEWSTLSALEAFKARNRVANDEITLWLKRMRKQTGARMRYLLVSEVHTGDGENAGLPHWHMLLHDCGKLRRRIIQQQWPLGFSKAVLVDKTDEKVPWYVCKYLTKSAMSRVRASLRYGETELIERRSRPLSPEHNDL